MHTEFMAFAGDDASLATLRSWAERQGFPAAAAQSGGPEMFAQMLEQSQAPKLAVVDIDGQSDPAAVVKRIAGLAGAECKLVTIGTANDIGLYRKMLTAGAVDYLVKPIAVETFGQAYNAALRGAIGGKGEAKEAKIVVMIGVRGGVGASTIAVNTGWLLAH